MAAAATLGTIGAEAKAAKASLRLLLRDDDGYVRLIAALSLWQVAEDTAGIPVATEVLLKVNDHEWRRRAVDLLRQMGPAAKTAIPALAQGLQNTKAATRAAAADALGNLGPEAKSAADALAAALNDKEEEVRVRAAGALWQINGDTAATVPVLLQLLGSKEKDTRLGAVHLLGQIGVGAKRAIPALTALVNDNNEDADVHQAAGAAVKAINPQALRTPAHDDRSP